MRLLTKHTLAVFGLVVMVTATPNIAQAKGGVYIDLPGISLGFHDRDRHHRKSRKHNRGHYDNYYYDDYGYQNRGYHKKHHKKYRKYKRHNRKHYNNGYNNRYYDNGYNDNYYGSGRRYDNSRRSICPTPGYSRYRDRNQRCYQHKDHYHCE